MAHGTGLNAYETRRFPCRTLVACLSGPRSSTCCRGGDRALEPPAAHKRKGNRGCFGGRALLSTPSRPCSSPLCPAEERLDNENSWHCDKCKEKTPTTKRINLFRLPECLIVHLKRFKYNAYGTITSKLETVVEFPVEGWDLRPWLPRAIARDYDRMPLPPSGLDPGPSPCEANQISKGNRARNARLFAVQQIPPKIPPVAQPGPPSIPGPEFLFRVEKDGVPTFF